MIAEIVIRIKSGILINVGVIAKIWKKILCERDFTWNPSTCTCKNGKYSGSIIGDSVFMCDDIIVAAKAVSRKTIEIKNFYVLLAFLLVAIASLIVVSIYCYLIKYRSKQEHYYISRSLTN